MKELTEKKVRECFKDVETDLIVQISNNEWFVAMKWHQNVPDMFERLMKLSAETKSELTITNVGAQIQIYVTEAE